MYFSSPSQLSQLYSAPTSSTEQIQSFNPRHNQNQDGSLLNLKSVLTPSVLSSTFHGSNSPDSEHTNDSSPTKDKISTIHGLERIGLLDINISKVFETENVNFAENQLIQNFEHWNTNLTQNLSVGASTSISKPLEPRSSQLQDEKIKIINTNRENSKLYLLNPIYLLARLRTSQYAIQLLTEKEISTLVETNSRNEELDLKARGMLAYDPNIFEQVEINSILSKAGSFCESSPSTCSLDSLSTDKSPNTSISEYNPCPDFITDIGRDFMLQIDDSPKEGISDLIVDPIQNWENTSNFKEISKFEDAAKSVSGPEYIYPIETMKKSLDVSENAQGNNITYANSMMFFNVLTLYQQLFSTPTTYHLMPYDHKTNCSLATPADNSIVNESKFNTNSNKSLTKYLSLYELITHFANRPDQLSNNLISENESNFLQSSNYKDPTLRVLKYEDSNPENIQNDLTEDSLAAYQYALESAARNSNGNFGCFQKNTASEEYLQLKLELSQPSLSIDSYENSSQEAISLSDEFDDDFDFENDSQDFAFIEAVNAEALANDFDGFYGQEFGLYSTPDVIGRNISYKNGGNSKTSGTHSNWNIRYCSREPLLSPITECSESSFCSPYEAPVDHSSNPTRDITTSGTEQFQSGMLKNDYEYINNFSSLMKLRQDL